jgi:hypothetical protein
MLQHECVGSMGAMMRAHDWSHSQPVCRKLWPNPLRMSVSLTLGSAFQMFVAWGQTWLSSTTMPTPKLLATNTPPRSGGVPGDLVGDLARHRAPD